MLAIAVLTLISSKTQILNGISSMTVLTGSMDPSIPQGSVVFVQKDNWYFPGDILTYGKTSDVTITHRLIEKVQTPEGEQYKLQGDANTAPDGDLVKPKNVIGKVIFHIPFVGWFSMLVRSSNGFLALIIAPGIIVMAHELWIIKKEIEYETERRVINRLQLH